MQVLKLILNVFPFNTKVLELGNLLKIHFKGREVLLKNKDTLVTKLTSHLFPLRFFNFCLTIQALSTRLWARKDLAVSASSWIERQEWRTIESGFIFGLLCSQLTHLSPSRLQFYTPLLQATSRLLGRALPCRLYPLRAGTSRAKTGMPDRGTELDQTHSHSEIPGFFRLFATWFASISANCVASAMLRMAGEVSRKGGPRKSWVRSGQVRSRDLVKTTHFGVEISPDFFFLPKIICCFCIPPFWGVPPLFGGRGTNDHH